jgi:hypothetical protein
MRHLHDVQGVKKKELARRFGRDVKTVRRALARSDAPLRRKPAYRGSILDAHRDEIAAWLASEPRITAKKVWILLLRVARRIHSGNELPEQDGKLLHAVRSERLLAEFLALLPSDERHQIGPLAERVERIRLLPNVRGEAREIRTKLVDETPARSAECAA